MHHAPPKEIPGDTYDMKCSILKFNEDQINAIFLLGKMCCKCIQKFPLLPRGLKFANREHANLRA
jgi:hypothetical protein